MQMVIKRYAIEDMRSDFEDPVGIRSLLAVRLWRTAIEDAGSSPPVHAADVGHRHKVRRDARGAVPAAVTLTKVARNGIKYLATCTYEKYS